jgi:hypothetical protein
MFLLYNLSSNKRWVLGRTCPELCGYFGLPSGCRFLKFGCPKGNGESMKTCLPGFYQTAKVVKVPGFEESNHQTLLRLDGRRILLKSWGNGFKKVFIAG